MDDFASYPDLYTYTDVERLVMQKRFAFNYPLGQILLCLGSL